MEVVAAAERTTRWAERCLAVKNPRQALFGIVQGGTNVELRLKHAEDLARLPLFRRVLVWMDDEDFIHPITIHHIITDRVAEAEREILRCKVERVEADASDISAALKPELDRFRQEIGDALFVSPRTIATHIDHILSKLDVRSRTAAVAFAQTRSVSGSTDGHGWTATTVPSPCLSGTTSIVFGT